MGSNFFGHYLAAPSPAHRLPVGVKYTLLFGVGVVPFLVGNPVVSVAAALCGAALLVLCARAPLSYLRIGVPFFLRVGALCAYHAWRGDPWHGITYACGLMASIYLARFVTVTTPASAVMDAIAWAARPLRIVGVKPQVVALSLALMWRSIPVMISILGGVGDAARARGLGVARIRLIVPAIVSAVGFGIATGEAVKARGLQD